MAGIDKTYVTSWSDYVKVRDWARSVGTVKDDFGNVFAPLDWMAEYEKAEFKESIENQKKRYREYYKDPKHVQEAKDALGQDWEPDKEGKGEMVLWNTPIFFDIWLIRHCPLDFIQERLKQQYASCYIELKEKRSEYDLYIRPAASSHFKLPRVLPKGVFWWEIRAQDFYYNENLDEWHHWLECREFSDISYSFKGSLDERKLARLISKWGFPAGTKLEIRNFDNGELVEVVIKK